MSDTLQLKKSTVWKTLTVVLSILLIISILTGGFNNIAKKKGSSTITAGPLPEIGTPEIINVNIKNSYFQGKEDAPVTLIEFSDFQCPFCGRFYSETESQILDQYVKTGKLRFVYKDFPLDSIHPQATPAALAARCAGEQGKFWEYHDLIFKNQQSLSDSLYKQLASQLKLDQDKFNSCYSGKKYLKEIRADFQEGSAAGVTGTPGFLLNGQLIVGAQPFSVFQQAIEAALAS
jgi:protein-disulfide isomerase